MRINEIFALLPQSFMIKGKHYSLHISKYSVCYICENMPYFDVQIKGKLDYALARLLIKLKLKQYKNEIH